MSGLAVLKRSLQAAASVVAGLSMMIAHSAVANESIAQRSVRLVPFTLEWDRRTAEAFAAKSLTSLTKVYAELGAHATSIEVARKAGQDACGCDVALANLRIIVGFAINKLDGQGRYQPWMRAESARLHNDYETFVADCVTDAGAPASPVRLQVKHVKGL
jgi:hypothetical protein